jgi:hypothetical protein
MSSGQLTCTPAKKQFFLTMFPHLDPCLVEKVVRKLSDKDPLQIMKKLNELSHVQLDLDELRAFVVSMAEVIDQPDLRMLAVPGDGRCLFHAVAAGLEEHNGQVIPAQGLIALTLDAMAGEWRGRTIEFLQYDKFDTDKSGEQLLQEHMESLHNGAWGGHIELRILADTLGLQIRVWASFREYAKSMQNKMASDVQVYQVSKDADYVLFSSSSCIGTTGDDGITLHLLYSGNSHYDCLLQA